MNEYNKDELVLYFLLFGLWFLFAGIIRCFMNVDMSKTLLIILVGSCLFVLGIIFEVSIKTGISK